MRKSEAVMEMTDVERIEQQRKKILALKSALRRAHDKAALMEYRWRRDKRA